VLTPYTGTTTIEADNTVIDGKLITSRLDVYGNHVTIRRSKIVIRNGDSDYSAIRFRQNSSGGLVDQVEIDGGGMGIAVELAGTGGTARAVNAYNTVDYFRGNQGSTVVDSYGHDSANIPDSHRDGFQSLGDSDLTLRHNTMTLYGETNDNDVVTIGNEYGKSHTVVIADNLLDGANFAIGLADASDVQIRGNRFGRRSDLDIFEATGSSFVWSDNKWDDTGATVIR
jgi:hypothetical protein